MTCYHPLQAYRGAVNPATGKRGIRFTQPHPTKLESLQVPCGQCIGCRLERSRQWAIRCAHEASLYDTNAFVTLTYDEDHLPSDGSLDKRTFQLFMKRLRKRFPTTKIRFFGCGEYGEKLSRPHYHLCLFNIDFPDKELLSDANNTRIYTSPALTELWPYGYSTIGDVTFESAAYVARYVTKKVTGDMAHDHYSTTDLSTGEYAHKLPEFVLMSRRPGIGRDWYDQYSGDLKKDFITVRGNKMRPPKYYDSLTEKVDPSRFDATKARRKAAALANEADNTHHRLAVKESIKLNRFKQLKRAIEC